MVGIALYLYLSLIVITSKTSVMEFATLRFRYPQIERPNLILVLTHNAVNDAPPGGV